MKVLSTLLFLSIIQAAFGQTSKLIGKVFDSKRDRPLQGAIVSLDGSKKYAATDNKGYFVYDSILPGAHTIDVINIGYPTKTVRLNISNIPVTEITIIDTLPFCKYDAARKRGICPLCKKKDKVIPILYGLPVGEMDKEKYRYAGCEITGCDPGWYCKRDKLEF